MSHIYLQALCLHICIPFFNTRIKQVQKAMGEGVPIIILHGVLTGGLIGFGNGPIVPVTLLSYIKFNLNPLAFCELCMHHHLEFMF